MFSSTYVNIFLKLFDLALQGLDICDEVNSI